MSDLLYVSPVIPGPTGKGVRMRSLAILEALAARHAVTCLVVPLWDPRGASDVPEEVARVADVVLVHPSAAYALPRRLLRHAWYRRLAAPLAARLGPRPLELVGVPSSLAAARLAGRRFDRVHAFRLCAAPLTGPFLAGARLSIDLDDLEGEKQRRLARLPGTAPATVAALEAEAALHDRLLAHWGRRADVLLVASARDRAALAPRVAATVVVAPNVLRAPPATAPLPAAPPHRITFVGGLDYAPNRDAVTWLVREIAPALGRHATLPWEIHVVGKGGPELLAELGATDPRLVAHGPVADVTTYLERSRAVVVPLRAGGGTRIKVLEALAHARPVVATSAGAEGLDLEDGTHLLIADTAEAVASRIAEVLADDALAARLAAAGRQRVVEAYSPEVLARALAAL